jgi:hypothetical protein
MSKKIIIGIDTGKYTGFAVWNTEFRSFDFIETLKIHEAIRRVEELIFKHGAENIHIRFEDARLRRWFGNAGIEKMQGAGSIKRDAVIWFDFLTDLKISFESVAPKNNTTKMKASTFKQLTRWEGRTSEHGRDAAMLIFGF